MHELGATGPACWSCEISMFDLNLDEGLHINGGRISLPGVDAERKQLARPGADSCVTRLRLNAFRVKFLAPLGAIFKRKARSLFSQVDEVSFEKLNVLCS
ncbi:unnamed protein product [Clavelina lepadiformis]|uniref:Uncharacterized protein n=1 Tax=Clavelina lepadiformis TaxID=159417 RepID=A0ABP0FI68_CLALP